MKINQHNSLKRNEYPSIQKHLLSLIMILMVSAFCSTKGSFAVFAQISDRNEKKITKETFKNEPIEFIELKSNGTKFKLNERLTQEEDWLKNFTIKFKNVSSKSMVYADIAIGFPETESTGHRMGMSLNYGVNPRAQKDENGNEIKLLLPGEVGEVSLSPKRFSILEKFIATRHSLSSLKQLHLTIVVVDFEDGTYWSAGSMFRPDPNKTGKYIAVEENTKVQ